MDRAQLRTAIRQKADMVDSLFVTDTEIDGLIDLSVADLYDILTRQYGDEYWATTTWIQVRGGTDPNIAWPRLEINRESPIPGPDEGPESCYALPDDFARLVRCQFFAGTVTRKSVLLEVPEGTDVVPALNWTLNCPDKRAYPMHPIDTAGQVIDFTPCDWRQARVAYRLRHGPMQQMSRSGTLYGEPVFTIVTHYGTAIEFLPVPNGEYAVQVTYVPTPSLLPNHPFPDYIIFDCAAQCLEKQRSDSSTLRALQARVVQRIEQYAKTPDAANPPKVVDIYGTNRVGGRRWPWP